MKFVISVFFETLSRNLFFYFNMFTVHLFLFCIVTNKCTIISQIITFLHVSIYRVIRREPEINSLPSYTMRMNKAYAKLLNYQL